MTDALAMAIVGMVSSSIAAYFSFKAKKTTEKTQTAVDGRLTQLLEVTKLLAIKEGVAQEKLDELKRKTDIQDSQNAKTERDKNAT